MGESTNACATLRFWSLGVAPAHGAGGASGGVGGSRGESNRLAVATPAPPLRPPCRACGPVSGRQDPCSFAR